MLAALPYLLPLALKAAPWLANMLGGGAAEQVTGAILEAAKKAFGPATAEEIQAKIASDQAAVEKFKAELENGRAELEARIADTQSAREQTVKLAEAGSAISWGAPIVSGFVVVGFLSVLGLFFFGMFPSTDTAAAIANMLVGSLAAAFVQVINYWLGSSAGSQRKDFYIANSVPAAAEPRPLLRRTT